MSREEFRQYFLAFYRPRFSLREWCFLVFAVGGCLIPHADFARMEERAIIAEELVEAMVNEPGCCQTTADFENGILNFKWNSQCVAVVTGVSNVSWGPSSYTSAASQPSSGQLMTADEFSQVTIDEIADEQELQECERYYEQATGTRTRYAAFLKGEEDQ